MPPFLQTAMGPRENSLEVCEVGASRITAQWLFTVFIAVVVVASPKGVVLGITAYSMAWYFGVCGEWFRLLCIGYWWACDVLAY